MSRQDESINSSQVYLQSSVSKHYCSKANIHHKYRIGSSPNRPFFYFRQYAGSHTSPIPGDAPVVDLAAMFIAQPRRSCWCKQKIRCA